MAGLSENVLKKLITPNAKALSSPKGDKIIDEGRTGNIDDFDDSMFLAETYEEPMDVQSRGGYLSENTAAKARALTDYSSNDFNPERVKKTKMSSAILEDMVKHPIDTTALNTQLIESAGNGDAATNNARLNKMLSGAKKIEEKLGDNPVRKARIMEQPNSSAGAGIDYSLIKAIIKECIDEKFDEMSQKGLLNEGSVLKGIGLSKGKIKLVDNSGNVFSAKLEYQGNTKDKK